MGGFGERIWGMEFWERMLGGIKGGEMLDDVMDGGIKVEREFISILK
jgi:hypothetical protein